MPEIDLKKTKIYVITVDKNKDRQVKIIQMLKKIGLRNYEVIKGEDSSPYWKGHKNSILGILKEHEIKKYGEFLILEDDATIIENNFNHIVEYPQRADMLYLGGTINGIKSEQPKNSIEIAVGGYFGLRYKEADHNWIKIYNMHSNHAMLFIKDSVRKIFIKSLSIEQPADVCFASIMSKVDTLLIKKPYWYQDDGRNNIATQYYYPPDIFNLAKKEMYKYWFPKRNRRTEEDRQNLLNIIALGVEK